MRAWLAAVVLLAPTLVACAAPPELKVGDPAPELGAKEFIGSPSVTLSALRGCVVACVFFRTSDPGAAEQVKTLSAFHEANTLCNFYLLGIADEPRADVDAFVAEHSPSFPIAIVAATAVSAYGVEKWPAAFLISPDGDVAWKGNWSAPGDEPHKLMEVLVKTAKPIRYLTGALEPSRQLFDDAKTADARARLAAIAASTATAAPVRETAEDAIRWIDFNAGVHLLAAQWREKFEGYLAGAFHYRQVIRLQEGLDAAKAAQRALDVILADPERKREVVADEKYCDVFFAWADSLFGINMMAAEKTKAIATLKSIAAVYKGTRGATRAQKLIEEIEKSME